ncbi:MAG: ankyrin repeat domain-containing protein [Oscillospiraceae bacterium]|nr:ankyrin repeat domain-containing protein [Oscillospiraceae bacterium]
MKPIETDIWRPKEDDPHYTEFVGMRSAVEVFEELKQRLDGMGLLPDEYFELAPEWKNGKLLPRDAGFFVTTDYGESEGVYLDAYLKWFEDGKSVTRSFFTGKTLGDTGADLDRMFLISSAITKAFHGDHGTYERYVRLGEQEKDNDMILNLTPKEQKLFIDALIDRREKLVSEIDSTEQLLRRMVGSITQYMDTVGERPLRISDFDRTMLAIRDGELEAFKELSSRVPDRTDELLVEAAGRAGAVGRKMTVCLLIDNKTFSDVAYLTASRRAVEVGDTERVQFLMENAMERMQPFRADYYGEVIQHAIGENRAMAHELLHQAPNVWIEAASPDLLYCAAIHPSDSYRLLDELVKKGAPCGDRAWEILHCLTANRNVWIAETLIQNGLKVPVEDYGAFDVCVRNGALDCAKMLLGRGLDVEKYTAWADAHDTGDRSSETLSALKEYWQSIHPQEQAAALAEAPAQGMTMGGLAQ